MSDKGLPFIFFDFTFFSYKYNNNPQWPFLYKMKNKPMGLISTPFISYHDIKVNDLDLIEDAWGLSSEFSNVINLLKLVKPVPGRRLTKRVINRLRKHG